MKFVILSLLGLALATTAFATVLATWTGKSEGVTTVTGKTGVKCEYDLYGKKFWKTIVDEYACPATIEVE